jgi:SAM-dependent methyltransferase
MIKPDATAVPSEEEVDDFLDSSTFTGYQSVPLPHGRRIPGTDRSKSAEAAFNSDLAGQSVLDVGTYYGFLPCDAARRGAERIVALEPDPANYEVAKRVAELHGHQWRVVNTGLEQFDSSETFDLVTCLNVIHHVPDPIEFLRALAARATHEVVLEFCLADDPDYIAYVVGSGSKLDLARAHVRSRILRLAAGRLPIMAVGNRAYHRVFYFSEAAFYNLAVDHLRLFNSVEFRPSAAGGRRATAYCRK